MIYILIYIIGVVLTYGRVLASFYDIQEKYYPALEIDNPIKASMGFIVFLPLLSWAGFLAGVILFFVNEERRFFLFKWNYHPVK